MKADLRAIFLRLISQDADKNKRGDSIRNKEVLLVHYEDMNHFSKSFGIMEGIQIKNMLHRVPVTKW